MRKHVIKIAGFILVLALISCVGKQRNILESAESQAKLRSIQSRVFDISDRNRLLRTIIATLQDLGFVIDDADETLGTVSGTKRAWYSLIMTVSVRPKGSRQMIVRSNAQYNLQTVEDPETYQQFFLALSRALFLEAHVNSAAGKAHSTGSHAGAGIVEASPKSANLGGRPKQTAPTYNVEEPWTGKWNVAGSARYFGRIWILKQLDKKVVSTEDSAYKIQGRVVGNKLEGKLNISSANNVRPFEIKMSSDGMSFTGTGTDYLGRSVLQLKGKRKE
jgi:hypothetical protein